MKLPVSQIHRPYLRQRTLSGMGDIISDGGEVYTGQPSSWPDMTQWGSVLERVLTVWNQQKILDANIERAKQGLPPIDTAAIAPTYNVGLSPDTRNLVTIALVGAGLFLLVKAAK